MKRLMLLLLLITALPASASAHGGGAPQMVNESAGPYWLSVWTSPEPAREGPLHVSIAIAEPGQGQEQQAGPPVLGASVQVTLTPRSGGFAAINAPATNEQSANKLFYEADLSIPSAGDWTVEIDVDGAEGSGQARFNLAVRPAQSSNGLLLGGLAFVLLAGFFLFYALRSRHD